MFSQRVPNAYIEEVEVAAWRLCSKERRKKISRKKSQQSQIFESKRATKIRWEPRCCRWWRMRVVNGWISDPVTVRSSSPKLSELFIFLIHLTYEFNTFPNVCGVADFSVHTWRNKFNCWFHAQIGQLYFLRNSAAKNFKNLAHKSWDNFQLSFNFLNPVL